MTLEEALNHAKGFGIVPTLIVLAYFHGVALPLLREGRDFVVFLYALGYAWAKINKIDLDAERKDREAEISPIADAPSLLGVLKTVSDSQIRKARP